MNARNIHLARALGPASLTIVLATAQASAQQHPAGSSTASGTASGTAATSTSGTASGTAATGTSGAATGTAATGSTAGGSTQAAGSGGGSTQATATTPAHPATPESASNAACPVTPPPASTAAQVEQASRMYDQAMAQRAGQDFAGAAASFETANRFAPSRQALSAAIRAHREVHSPEHDARAATLALELRALYPTDQRAVTLADQTVQDLAAGLTRVTVNCQCCAVRADNRLRTYEFFVEPGTHNVVAEWSEQRSASHQFNAVAGQTETYNVEAPPIPPHTETHATPTPGNGNVVVGPPPPPPSSGFPIAVPVAAAVATVISGAILAWSYVDMSNGAAQYTTDANNAHMYAADSMQALQAQQELNDGRGRELRTDILIGTTAVLGAVTIGTLALYFMSGSSHEAAPTNNTNGGGAAAHARRHRLMFSPVTAGATGIAPGMTLQGSF